MEIEHIRLPYPKTCRLLDKGLKVIKEKLDSVLNEEKSTVVFNLISSEIELVREINVDLRSVAESQLSVMNHELKLYKEKYGKIEETKI